MQVNTNADHARIADALKVNKCPDCGNVGFEPGARRPGTNKSSEGLLLLGLRGWFQRLPHHNSTGNY